MIMETQSVRAIKGGQGSNNYLKLIKIGPTN